MEAAATKKRFIVLTDDHSQLTTLIYTADSERIQTSFPSVTFLLQPDATIIYLFIFCTFIYTQYPITPSEKSSLDIFAYLL